MAGFLFSAFGPPKRSSEEGYPEILHERNRSRDIEKEREWNRKQRERDSKNFHCTKRVIDVDSPKYREAVEQYRLAVMHEDPEEETEMWRARMDHLAFDRSPYLTPPAPPVRVRTRTPPNLHPGNESGTTDPLGLDKGKRERLYRRHWRAGPPPFGYRKSTDGLLEVVPEQAEIVRLIFRLYLTPRGTSKRVTVLLNRTSEKPWRTQTICYILRNRTYLGRTQSGSFTPIIAPIIFNLAQKKLDSSPQGRSRRGKKREGI